MNKEILKQVQKLSNNKEVIDLKTLTSFLTSIPGDKNNSLGGHVFERFAKAYLQLEGFKEVYLLHELPNKAAKKLNLDPNNDYGVDLVYKTLDGRYIGVQCKFRGNHKQTLSWSKDKLTNLTAHKGLDGYMVFTNAQGVDSQLMVQEKSLEIVKWDNLYDLNREDFKLIRKSLQGKKIKRNGATPRAHQVPAIKNVTEGFLSNDRGQLILPCRAGKTVTSLIINEKMNNNLTLVLVPTLGLLSQFKNEWRKFRNKEFNYFCVCSAGDIDKESGEEAGSLEDLGMSGLGVSTDSKEIQLMLKKLNSSKESGVVFSTYQSLPKLIEALGKNDQFDLIVCDEAHRTASDSSGLFSLVHKESNIKSKKRLYMTATPKVLSSSLKQDKKASYFADMDDENVFGPELHRLSFAQAIELGIISDYKVVIAEVSDKQIAEHIENRSLIENGDYEMLATSAALEKLYKDYGVKNALSFHSKIKRATAFSDLQTEFDENREIYTVNSKMKMTERRSRIVDFCEADNALMTNVKCLTEGITMPKLDAVVVADPINSTIMLVQAVSRALNKKEDEKEAIIFIPVYTKPGETADKSIQSSAFKNAIKTIRALSDHDERIAEIIKTLKFEEGERKPGLDGGVTIGGKIVIYTEYEKDKLNNHLRLKELSSLFRKRTTRGIPWTRDLVENLLIEKKYKSILAWQKDDNASLAWSRKHDWYEEIVEKYNLRTKGFKRSREQIEDLLAEKKYKNILTWEKDDRSSQRWAYKQDWYEEVVEKYRLRQIKTNRTREQIENLLTEKKYKNMYAWTKDNSAAQQWARKQDWYEEVVEKYGLRQIKTNRTREQIEELLKSKNYKHLFAWQKDDHGSQRWARNQVWYNEVAEKFNLRSKQNNRTREQVESLLAKKKYVNINTWQKDDVGSQQWAGKQDWYEEVVEKFNLRQLKLNRTREQIENLLAEKKYKNISYWVKDDPRSYSWASKRDWYKEVVEKYNLRKKGFKRTREQIEDLLAEKKYKNISAWIKDDASTQRWAFKQDWYEEMVEKYSLRKKGFKRTREQIEDLLAEKKYKNISAWIKDDPTSQDWSRKRDWYSEIKEKYFGKKDNVVEIDFKKKTKKAA